MLSPDTLQGKVVIITGGGSGLGLSMAAHCQQLGARVGILGRSQDRLDSALASLDPTLPSAAAPADVREPDEVESAIQSLTSRLGPPDVLINNAAGNFLAPSEDLSPRGFDAVVRTALHGTFHASQAVGKRMIEGGTGGTILSIVTTYAWTGSAFVLPSAAAKAGVLAMTRSLAVEWATYGIRVNAIAPGPFPTEGAWNALMPTPEIEAAARKRIPLNRFGEHRELTNLVAFLISDASPFITGEVVTIDGGEWLASGGEFNHLTQLSRDEVKGFMKKMRG